MDSNDLNYPIQNQRQQYPNYIPDPIENPIQVPNEINNSTDKTQQYRLRPIIKNTKQNKIQIENNINISYNLGISNQNMIQGKSNQVIPSYESNINKQNLNQNVMNSEDYLTQNINQLTNKNSIVKTKRENEGLCGGHLGVPMKLANKAMKSICKISYDYDNKQRFGNGFFLKLSDSLKLLITNYHVLFPELMNINIQIEIFNNEKMILNLRGRYIKFMEIQDITAIKIEEKDEVYKYIQFLNYDLNYNHNGYNIYNDSFEFSIEHPLG